MAPSTEAAKCVDIALTELGEAAAEARLTAMITNGTVGEAVLILERSQFITKPAILSAMAEMLKDKRTGPLTDVTPIGGPTTYRRVCDHAFDVLASRSGISFESIRNSKRKLDDLHAEADLSAAYKKLKEHYRE